MKEELVLLVSLLGLVIFGFVVGWIGALALAMVFGGTIFYDRLVYKRIKKDFDAVKAKDPRNRRG